MGVQLRDVTSAEVAEFAELAARVARKYHGVRGAEYDDLNQEGLIAIWKDLSLGRKPSEDSCKDRARSWVRFVSREGMGGFDEGLYFDEL